MEYWKFGGERHALSPSFHHSNIPTEGIRLWAVFEDGSAHEPPPENVGSGRDVVGILNRRRVRA
jgi:hypothetical protein